MKICETRQNGVLAAPKPVSKSSPSGQRQGGVLLSIILFLTAWQRSEVKGKPGGNPEPGDGLCFVFVCISCMACVRAGEAKLQVRARCRVFLLGRRRLWEVVLRSRTLCEAQDVAYMLAFRQNGSKCELRDAHCVCFILVFSRSFMKHVYMALVL